MEQKHIDELEETYFGEETIDDDYPVLKVEEKKEKKSAPVAAKVSKPASTPIKKKEPEIIHKEDLEEVQIKPARVEPMREHREVKIEAKETVPTPEPTPSSVKSEVTPSFTEEPKSGSSGWKWFALILFVLVIVSIFTNGFGLYSKNVPGQVTMAEAEKKMLDYVNSNLLPAPLVAEVADRSEESTLYRFTLSVAGESVESYVTKDGQLFFPRGFEMNNSTVIVLDQGSVNTSKPETPLPVTTANGTELTISAKKWMFDPNTLYVKVGEKVKLTIKSTDLDFVFSIPDLQVQTAVSGITLVEFTPTKAGKYKYLCSSCESWRGLEGTLIVE